MNDTPQASTGVEAPDTGADIVAPDPGPPGAVADGDPILDAGNDAGTAAGADPETDTVAAKDGAPHPGDSIPATGEVDDEADDGGAAMPAGDPLIREGDIAGDYLERLLDIIDSDGDIDLDVAGDRAAVAVVGDRLEPLIGARGATLDALQELTRLAVLQQTGVRSRLMLDIGGFRERRRAELVTVAENAAERVREHGDPIPLAAMNPFERKVVHDAVGGIDGVMSESEGEEPNRRVVVLPQA